MFMHPIKEFEGFSDCDTRYTNETLPLYLYRRRIVRINDRLRNGAVREIQKQIHFTNRRKFEKNQRSHLVFLG